MKIPYYHICFLLFICSCYSQEESMFDMRLRFHLIDVSSGLSNNFVNDIVQDSLGFIWISTFDGLNRYDGTHFVQFKKRIHSAEKGLSNNFVKELKLLDQSQLLIATDDGLDIYDFRSESFNVINSEYGLTNNSVSAIGFTPDDQVMLATYPGAIQIMDEKWNLKLPPHLANLSTNEISSITSQNDTTLWVGTNDQGLIKINYLTKELTALPFGPNTKFPSAIINKLYTDSKGNLWVGSRQGVQVITTQGETLSIEKSDSFKTGLSDNDILCFSEDGLGNLWIGTRNGGLNILQINSLLQADQKLNIKWFLPRTDGLSVYNRTVSALMRDSANNMWLGTPTGINYVNPKGEAIELIQRNLASNSISHDRIGALSSSKDHKIWVGTDGNGIDLFDSKRGVIRHYKHEENNRNSLSNNYIISLLEDSNGRLWAGTYRGGLHKINPKNNNIEHYLEGSPSEGSDVRVIFESKNKDIWVGTNRGGLYKYNSSDDTFTYIAVLGKIDVRDIDQDSSNNLWLATYGSGIIKYNPVSETYKSYNQQNTPELTSDVMFSIMVLNDNDILCGTRYGGLIRMDPETVTVKNFTKQDGLSNNTICSLIAEDDTYVWMGTYNGISRYNLHTDEIIDLYVLNNIQNGEFNIGAIAKNNSGMLFLGGNNGLNIIKTADIKDTKANPPLIYNELRVLNKVVSADSTKGAIIDQSILFKDKITLRHHQNTFSLGFAALKYPEAKNVSYSYKLENYNDFWIETQGVGLANFTNVPPGDYKLKVKMNTGFKQSNNSELDISILPPFWKTWFAYLLYALLIALITWLILKYYAERIHLKNSLLFEKKQRHLEHELNEERLRFITAFSHELKTSLTLVIAPIENLITREKSIELKNRLIFIRKNGKKLFQSINQLLEFRKSEEGLSKLDFSKQNLPSKIQKWMEIYHPLANSRNITLTHSIRSERVWFLVDIEKIEIIFNNILSNAIKYCKKEGKVHVDFSYNEEGFTIKVSDTGIGIIKDELENIFNWYYRSNSTLKKDGTGIGLALSKRFAELHNGTIRVESIPGEKTEFVVDIPIKYQKDEDNTYGRTKKIQKEIALKSALLPYTERNNDYRNRSIILIIDDNPDMLYFLNDICKQEFDVILAVDGVDGIQKATQYIPNLILSDIMMPEKDGIDLCRNLKKQYSTSHIPIILLTAKSNIESITLGYNEGADDYITKPFHPQLLITRIKNLLNSRLHLQKYFINKNSISLDEMTQQESQILDTERKFLAKLDATIQKHIENGTDKVGIIAKDIGMSRTSLYRKLKATTGMSINEYIRNLKIELAVELIQNNKLSISQASYQVGFSNIKYFRKVFKEKYGKNPSEFKA